MAESLTAEASGNTPPWAGSKAKREYLEKYELVRAAKMLRIEDIVLPEDLRALLDLGWTQKASSGYLL